MTWGAFKRVVLAADGFISDSEEVIHLVVEDEKLTVVHKFDGLTTEKVTEIKP